AVGKGSVFHIYLPVAEEPATSTKKREAGISLNGTETILLVEDKDDVRDFGRRSLIKNGYHVLEACNGVKALEIERQFSGPIHLLLTDTIMPQMNGAELARQISHRRPGIKILFTSG